MYYYNYFFIIINIKNKNIFYSQLQILNNKYISIMIINILYLYLYLY